jgi:hypothetical protein
MPAVKFRELAEAFEFVSCAGVMEHEAYIDRLTGKIYWAAEGMDEELPEDVDTSARYLPLPHKNDLDLGTNLVLKFAADVLPDQYRRIQEIFRHGGAYARFKGLLAAEGRLEEWYAFEATCTDTALREWCEENDLTIIETDTAPR